LEEAPHRTLSSTWFGRGYGPFVGQILDEDLKVGQSRCASQTMVR